MATQDAGREEKVRAALERARQVHAECMARMDDLRKQQLRIMEGALGRMARERASKVLAAIQSGSFEDILTR